MSTDNNSLEDMVENTLESTGVLSKMRAELRASVFHVLEKGPMFQNKLYTDKIKNLVSNTNGLLLLSLVKDLLDCLELTFTASVFDSETGAGNHYQYKDKNDIFDELLLSKDDQRPLLMQILETHQSHSKSCKNEKNNTTKPNGNFCSESYEKSNFKVESSKTLFDVKSSSTLSVKTNSYEHDSQFDKHTASGSFTSSHSNSPENNIMQIKEVDSSVSLNSSSIEQLSPKKGPSSIEQSDNIDEDINSDLKSNKNDTSLQEVETEENISCGTDSIQSLDLSDESTENIKIRNMHL